MTDGEQLSVAEAAMTSPTAVLGASVRGHRRALLPALARFVVAGALSVGSDVTVLFVLHGLLHVQLVVATTCAYASSLVVNYTLNHVWVFASEGQMPRRLGRYLLLVGVNYASTIAFVTGLTAIGLFYLLSKAVAVAVNAVMNFVAFRGWVFR